MFIFLGGLDNIRSTSRLAGAGTAKTKGMARMIYGRENVLCVSNPTGKNENLH